MAKKNILIRSKMKKALALAQQNQLTAAQGLLRQICQQHRTEAEAWFNLGVVNGKLDLHEEAIECFRQALNLRTDHAQTHYNLGIALRELGQLPEAISCFQQTLQLAPNHEDVHESLAHALMSTNKMQEAEELFKAAILKWPNKATMHTNLGTIYEGRGDLTEAEACYRQALRVQPGLAGAYDNLGSVLCSQGKLDEAIACNREGLKINPGDSRARSNMLLTFNYMPDVDPKELLEEHKLWQQFHQNPSRVFQRYDNTIDPDRRLRIGYVSSDFRRHSVAYYFEPLLAAHDKSKIEVFCYSGVSRPDVVTERLQSTADHWTPIFGKTNAQIVEAIHNDQVDILVDLAGHTGTNYMAVFAHKPAPIQVTYLGYPNTTGLSTIDYRFTDALADPEGQEEFHTERLMRLPGCFLCYQGLEDSPDIAELPAIKNGFITFGSFNNLAKMNERVVTLWAKILMAVPNSRLLLKNVYLKDKAAQQRVLNIFKANGVDTDRVEILGLLPSVTDHLATYHRVDIGLDTFPYNGTTTTCEALWMGLPVITLVGQAHAGRVGLSLLSCLGLQDLIANSADEYIDRAVTLSQDTKKLAELRTTMREQMLASPLCDAKQFAQHVEKAYREMWQTWCENI